MQVDVFSFGVVIYELLIRQVTSAVVSQSGDASMSEMYANKVNLFSVRLPLMPLNDKLTHSIIPSRPAAFICHQNWFFCCMLRRQADKQTVHVFRQILRAMKAWSPVYFITKATHSSQLYVLSTSVVGQPPCG